MANFIPFAELSEWIAAKEAADLANVRVAVILSTDNKAPEAFELKRSYPAVKKGPDGYEDTNGHFYLYRPE